MNHNIIISYQTPGLSVSGTKTVSGDSELTIVHPWTEAPAGVDMEQVFSLANAVACVVQSSVAATLVTKAAGGSTVETLTLAAGIPQVASTHAEVLALLGATAVSAHLTSAVAAGTLNVSILFDSAT